MSKTSKDKDDRILFKSTIKGYGLLSNFYPFVKDGPTYGPGTFTDLDDPLPRTYSCVEEYYQRKKYLVIDPAYLETVVVKDARSFKHIAGMGVFVNSRAADITGGNKAAAIRLYKKRIENFDRVDTMRRALSLKFSQNPKLKEALIKTGDKKLSEQGRFKDDFWGHTGQDMLGKLLMELRERLRKG